MKENIEVKDVQRTEYLDKNGLDMLWTKVKENTHNQVEVEYNRAKAKEDSLSQEIASVKPAEGKVFLQAEVREDGKVLKDDTLLFGEPNSEVFSLVDAHGFYVGSDVDHNSVTILPTGIETNNERKSDTKVWNTNGGITDLINYAKKTDIPEVNTSDFVSKTATDAQIINSDLGIVGGDIQIVDYTENSDPVTLELHSSELAFNGCDRSTITLNASDVNSNNGSRIIIEAYNENPQITLQGNVGSDYGFSNNLTITNEGISNTDNNANHVYATDGSIADLTQYAKKAEIPTAATKESLGVVKVGDGLNVTDGTISVGNYIPYESIDDKTYVMKHNEGILFDSGSGDVSIQDGEIKVKSDVREICVTPSFIWLQEISDNRETLLFELNENGLRLRGGDNNHVLTSYGSTIDITRYALKSVYDEKIAALEARIAALEAKHTETA